MATDKIEIKIIKDSKQSDAELDSMSLEVARAFLVIAESLTRIAEKTNNNEDLKIEIKKGSVCVGMVGECVPEMTREFYEIVNNESSNKELIEPWRNIQTLFLNNGIVYDAAFTTQGKRIPFYETLKTAKKLRAKANYSNAKQTNIVFISGTLIEVGGKTPNIHVDTSDGKKMTIKCNEIKANKAKAFLYKTIFLSGWVTENGDKKEFELCDSYFESQMPLYGRFQSFISKIHAAQNEIDALKLLHFECRYYLDKKEYKNFRKFLRLFNHHSSDINMLNTILIVTQGVKELEDLNTILFEMQILFESKIPHFKKIKKLLSGK